ncbi:MAG: sigma-70 family RNA polymerase sigma factor [Deltaproteobacteria bacterium]|nr:sigma-70 family RNA polymerase sigma factor [Deltaproteobacteria bacterium]
MPPSSSPGAPFGADTVAYRAAFVRHYEEVRRLLAQITRDVVEAEDLTQEVFVALHRERFSRTAAADVRRWLLRVALNRGLNALRSRGRRQAREQASDAPAAAEDPETVVAARATQSKVRAALATLEPRAAKLLTLRQLGLSYAELADVVEVRSSSIGTLLVRAQRAFVEAYTERYGVPAAEEIA